MPKLNLIDKIFSKEKCEELEDFYSKEIVKHCATCLYYAYGRDIAKTALLPPIHKKDGWINLETLDAKYSRNGRYWIEANGRRYAIESKSLSSDIRSYKKYRLLNRHSALLPFFLPDIIMDYSFHKDFTVPIRSMMDKMFCLQIEMDEFLRELRSDRLKKINLQE